MRLERCRTVWGETALSRAWPETATVSDALYLPCRHDGTWGLFARGDCLGGTGHAPADPAALPAPAETAPEADYLYIGPVILHYGHFLTDTLSRLWPLAAGAGAGERERPPVRLLCHALDDPGTWHRHRFLAEILAGLGLRLSDLVVFDRPVRIPRVRVPSPSFRGRACAHAVFGDLCRRIGRGMFRPEEVDADARPVYLAKTRVRGAIGQLVNEGQLVDELDRRGVEIVHPETLGFSEQVRLFARRKTVLGTAGSAFHTSLFSAPGRRIVGLNWAQAVNANFPLFDALNGNRAYYYWAHGTTYEAEGAYGVRWTVAEPERVAAELLESAEAFERLDARDAAQDAARARRARGLGMRLRRRLAGWLTQA